MIFEKLIEYKMFVLIFSTPFDWNVSHSKKNWAKYNENVCWSVDRFFKNTQIEIFKKILSLGTELFHEDRRTGRRTEMMKIIFAFRKIANAPKKRL
jgi:hypothetical protein